ncbi:uncharacterized protein DUF4255 [Alteromonadaceae bacterium 2753L.S.0a.02]|nr:uncharacterized protein DUF4255 [Alteromonadaceae bacterium 2753L.S.0a.02]
MAGLNAVNSFGDSLMQFLGNTYPNELRGDYPCDFRVVSSNELNEETDFGTAVTFYLYRLIVDQHQRNTFRAGELRAKRPPLALDLHFMISIWADSPAAEHAIAAWAMRQMYQYPIMDGSSLTLEGQWQSGEIVHVIPAEISNEDLMRIWDAITPGYRLSMSYIARSVRIDLDEQGSDLPVVAKRLGFTEKEVADG